MITLIVFVIAVDLLNKGKLITNSVEKTTF